MLPLYPAQQLLRGISAPLTATLTDADGEPVDSLAPTCTIVDAAGAVVRTNAVTTDNGDGSYSVTMTALELADLAWLTASWSVGGIVRTVTQHEVVGGFYSSLKAIKEWDEAISAAAGNDDEKIRRTRATVEQAFEAMTGVAFVPRYRRDVLDGYGQSRLLLPMPRVRRILSVTYVTSSTSFDVLDAARLAALTVDGGAGILRYRDQCGQFPTGAGNIIIETEHGADQPPNEIVDAAIAYLRERLQHPRNTVPDRAISYTVTAGGTYRLATPDGWKTGNPDIDAILERHSWRDDVGIA